MCAPFKPTESSGMAPESSATQKALVLVVREDPQTGLAQSLYPIKLPTNAAAATVGGIKRKTGKPVRGGKKKPE